MSSEKRVMPERTASITPFLVMDILERAKRMEALGEDVVHLEVGEPDFATPPPVREAAKRAIDLRMTGYAPSLGLPELREAVAERYRGTYGVDIPAERVIITSGSSPALQMVFAAILDPGDEVIMTDPHYACYSNVVRFFGGRPVFIRTKEEENFRFNPDDIIERVTGKTRAVLVNSPANPTGVVMPGEDLERIAGIGVTVVSDEIYHGLVYEGKEHSILEFSDDAFVVDGFSKRFAMTGWRLGYAVVPERYVRPIQRLVQNFYISAPTLSQWGGLEALRSGEEYLVRMRDEYRRRRDFLMKGLGEIGLETASKPAGAFYILVNVSRYTRDSLQFSVNLLEKAKVAVAPGIDFGEGGREFIRLSYATSMERIGEGLKRIHEYLREGGGRAHT